MDVTLEALIEDHAHRMAREMPRAADNAKSEEDIRHDCNKLIDEFIEKAELNIIGRHEYGLAGGRIDSKYGAVVIEYKNPAGASRLTADPGRASTKALVDQVRSRLYALEEREHVGVARILGVGTDGNRLVFVRALGGTVEAEGPLPVTPFTVQRLLRALVSLGARGLSFTPENLAQTFGSGDRTAREGVRLLYGVIHETKSRKARTFFRQWQVMFREVCHYDLSAQNTKIETLAKHYYVPGADPAELLFALHTYYAIFMKMLAAEIVSSLSPLGTSALRRLVVAPTDTSLREELLSLEEGGIWTQLGIRNFLEGDLFSWYLAAWNNDSADAVRAMTVALDRFDPTTLSVDPAETRDLLKRLYQELFPRKVRHDLGEYYTPDWLAEVVLDELGYDGNPNERLLDPACGSGTFLVAAIGRVKKWFERNRYECGYDESELVERVLNNIVGFDLNPLAAMAARTNYLMAVRDLLRHAPSVELPVYLCDSVMTPAAYGDLFTGSIRSARRLKTSVGDFDVPVEVTSTRRDIGRYADVLESCVRNECTPEEFLQRCASEGLPTDAEELHVGLYGFLRDLEAEGRNGVWTRIIKNAFAPLFVGIVDFVVGNPPWVNWESLPGGYRQDMKPLWFEYGLFTLKATAARLGGGKKDLSMLFTYVAADAYLAPRKRLCFVITQSVFKSEKAADGFRRFRYSVDRGEGETIHLRPLHVHDLSSLQVFDDATNRCAVLLCEKGGEAVRFPVKYTTWRGPSRIDQDETLPDVLRITTRDSGKAVPVDSLVPTSPWFTPPVAAFGAARKVLGRSEYSAFAGCCTWLNGVYWLRVLEVLGADSLLVENLHDIGRYKVKRVEAVIDSELVYPLLRGRDVERWSAEPSVHIVLAQDPETRRGIPESEMRVRWPRTYAYLKRFEGDRENPRRGTLRGRSGYRKYFKAHDPFYSIYNVRKDSLAADKVVWREQTALFQAALVGSEGGRAILADHKLMVVACSGLEEAAYLLAMLNSSPARLAVRSYVMPTSTSTHVLQHVRVPPFQAKNADHVRLAELGFQCGEAKRAGRKEDLVQVEGELDGRAGRVWRITGREMEAIAAALRDQ